MKIEEINKNKFEIIVPPNIEYIKRDWHDFELPKGQCILNKKITGCGITEWAIGCNKDLILCSPRIMLLDNKYDQHKNDVCYILHGEEEDKTKSDEDLEIDKKYVEGEDDEQEQEEDTYVKIYKQVRNFIEENDGIRPLKLIVTYDSFPVLKLALSNLCYLNRFQIVVDEFQSLLVDSRFKADTELSFLWSLRSIENLCYVSATPMIEEYITELPELKDLPYYSLNWEKDQPGRTKKPNLKVRSSESVYKTCKKILDSYLTGKFESKFIPDEGGNLKQIESKEAVIFVNSVNNIISIVKKAGLKPDQINILCAKNKQNEQKIKKKLGKKFEIGKIPLEGEIHKMFTFCTRTVYLGADFYSECARTFIISDANIDTLAVDISLDLPQILGRQRNNKNPWKDEATLYFKLLSTTKVMTKEDFENIIKEKMNKSEASIKTFNQSIEAKDMEVTENVIRLLDNTLRFKRYKEDYISLDYSDPNNPKPIINKLVKLAEKRAFDIQQVDFADRFTLFSRIDAEIGLDEVQLKVNKFFDEYANMKTTYYKLKALCSLYEDDLNTFNNVINNVMDKNFQSFFNVLGKDKIVSTGYDYAKLLCELKYISTFNNAKFIEDLRKLFKVGERYTNSYIKESLENLYYSHGGNKNKKFNPSDLKEWFVIRSIKITVNGKRENGFLVGDEIPENLVRCVSPQDIMS